MQKDQLDGLLALKLVAEKKNFTAAAETLSVTPSAISQMITQLEKRLKIPLLTRTTRSVSLTEAGERFLSLVSPALDQILVAQEDIITFAKKPSGLLRLNLLRAIYLPYLNPLITSFVEKYPDITIELCFEDHASDIFEKGFDAGIRLSDILAKDMTAIKLYGPVRFVVAGAPKYFKKHGRPQHPKDLLNHSCLRVNLGTYTYEHWEFEEKGKDFSVLVKGPLIFNDSTFMNESAMDGTGLIYAAEDSLARHIKSGKLELVLEKYAAVSDGFHLYYPKKSQVLPKLRAFIDHIRANAH